MVLKKMNGTGSYVLGNKIFYLTPILSIFMRQFCSLLAPLFSYAFCWACRWEKYQSEEEAALGRGKRMRKAVSYREAYAAHPNETLNEVLQFYLCFNEVFCFF